MKRFLLSKSLLATFCLAGLLMSFSVYSQVTLQWVRSRGKALVADDFGNVYVTSAALGTNDLADYVTTKYNSSGAEQWVARYDGFNGSDYATAIAIDKSGNLYVTGYSDGNGTNTDIVTIKYNNDGAQQ